jgi:hypothetical protein
MSKLIFSNFNDGHLIAFGFILFTVTFVGVLTWTLFVQKKSFYTKMSEIPLSEGGKNGRE